MANVQIGDKNQMTVLNQQIAFSAPETIEIGTQISKLKEIFMSPMAVLQHRLKGSTMAISLSAFREYSRLAPLRISCLLLVEIGAQIRR